MNTDKLRTANLTLAEEAAQHSASIKELESQGRVLLDSLHDSLVLCHQRAQSMLDGQLNIRDRLNRAADASHETADMIRDLISRSRSNAESVREFTEQSWGEIPATPQISSRDEVLFIIKMVKSELVELAQTVTETPEEAEELVRNSPLVDTNRTYKCPTEPANIIADQVDAAVDIMYYLYNHFAKRGVNADKVFKVVHEANMAKRWEDGKFHLREEDRKVIKPAGWVEPDVVGEVKRQMEAGAWAKQEDAASAQEDEGASNRIAD